MAETKSDSWVSGGVTFTIETICGSNESPQDCCDRHDADLAAAMVRWPED